MQPAKSPIHKNKNRNYKCNFPTIIYPQFSLQPRTEHISIPPETTNRLGIRYQVLISSFTCGFGKRNTRFVPLVIQQLSDPVEVSI